MWLKTSIAKIDAQTYIAIFLFTYACGGSIKSAMITNFKQFFVAAALTGAICSMSWGQPSTIEMPLADGIGQDQGTLLVQLARGAMMEYLKKRTPADKQSIPTSIQKSKVGKDTTLAQIDNGVAVSLREDGKAPIRIVRKSGNLCRNVISAALEAMRSPMLPDVVTPKVLESLTIEVEVIGNVTEVPEDSLLHSVQKGFTGLELTVGQKEAFVLPSTCYLQDLDVSSMRRICLGHLKYDEKLPPAGRKWRTFASRHFVGYPNCQSAIMLYRGKLLPDLDALNQKDFAATASAICEYLIKNQAADGMYRSGMVVTSLAEHMYATYVMTKMARITGNQRIAKSAGEAIQYGQTALLKSKPGDDAIPQDALACCSLLAMAIKDASPTGKGLEYYNQTIEGIKRLVVDFAANIASRQAANNAAMYNSICIAMLALDGQLPPEAATIMESVMPPTSQSLMWAKRAGIKMNGQTAAAAEKLLPVQQTANAPADEIGGFAPAGCEPDVSLTAAMIQLGSDANATLAARRFCCMMVYRKGEAYFESDPNSLVGGARFSPSSAVITVKACAATIEALVEMK